jgi:hypothetical protein
MPNHSKDEKRAADMNGDAASHARTATEQTAREPATTPRGHLGGAKGGPARARALTPEQRSAIARIAASARWKKGD